MEKRELMNMLEAEENEDDIKHLIDEIVANTTDEISMQEEQAFTILQKIVNYEKHDKLLSTGVIFKFAKIAAIIAVVVTVLYWVNTRGGKDEYAANLVEQENTVQEELNSVLLTMSDGRSISLDNVREGDIIHGYIQVKNNGILVHSDDSETDSEVTYNVLSTPPGRQFHALLPDGSKVWLNASSSLYFPSVFDGPVREVFIFGEAYFEVVENKEKPFCVKVDDMEIKVIGTNFNVNAYKEDEQITTSLIEGSIRITYGNMSALLKPGEQGIVRNAVDQVDIRPADTNHIVAWKNGLFHFEGADIKTIMNQISRWYDVDVTYPKSLPKRSFNGKITRTAKLQEILQILELQNVKYKIEGRRITVL